MKTLRKDSLTTRKQLIDAAESLFAEKGLDNVSLVDITRTAGQKNRNALQYHFGDKAGLINAVLDKHADEIAQVRSEMLDELNQQEEYSLHDAVRVLVLPIANRLNDKEGGKAYLNINSQMMASTVYADLRLKRAQNPETRRMTEFLTQKMPAHSRKELTSRMMIVDCMLFHSLSAFSSRPAGIARELFVETLIDSICAVVSDHSSEKS